MKSVLAPALIVVLAVMMLFPAQAQQPAPTSMMADQLPALIKQIETSAQAWLKEDVARDEALEKTLLGVRYSEEIIPALTAAMNAPRPDPINLYVINRLLEPLDPPSLRSDNRPIRRSSVDFNRKLLPALKSLDQRLAKYQDMPKIAGPTLEAIKMPAAAGDIANEAFLRQVETVQKRRDEKIVRERPIALHNQQAGRLRQYIWRLTLACEDPKEDQQIISRLPALEKSGSEYKALIEVINREIPYMSPERAKSLYDALLKIGEPLRLAMSLHRDPSNTPVNPAGFSAAIHDREAEQPGILIYGLINRLANVAKAPGVAVPTASEVVNHFDMMQIKMRQQ